MKRFKCKECGYIHIGDEPPEVCPVCAYDSSVFVEMESIQTEEKIEYFEMIDTDDINLIKNIRHNLDLYSNLASVSKAMSFQAKYENLEESSELLSSISEELNKQAAIYAMFLGEFLEFNTGANLEDLKKKLSKLVTKNEEILELLDDGEEYYNIVKDKNYKIKELIEKI